MPEAVITKEGTLNFPHVWKARDYKGDGNFKYSCEIVFDSIDDCANLVEQHEELMEEYFPDGLGRKQNGHFDDIFRPGETAYPDNEFFEGKICVRFSVKEEDGVDVLDEDGDDLEKKSDIYSGCKGRILGNLYAFKGGNGGITTGLYAVQVTGDGEALGTARPDAKKLMGSAIKKSGKPNSKNQMKNSPKKEKKLPPPKKEKKLPPKKPKYELTEEGKEFDFDTIEEWFEAGWSIEDMISEGYAE